MRKIILEIPTEVGPQCGWRSAEVSEITVNVLTDSNSIQSFLIDVCDTDLQ